VCVSGRDSVRIRTCMCMSCLCMCLSVYVFACGCGCEVCVREVYVCVYVHASVHAYG